MKNQKSFSLFRLLEISIKRLDSRPSYQISAGLRRYLSQPLRTLFRVLEDSDRKAGDSGESERVSAALKLMESTRKVLECPVCYLPCPPPRIWQVGSSLHQLSVVKYCSATTVT